MTLLQTRHTQMEIPDANGQSIAPQIAPHPLAILHEAVQRGADVNTLERISVLAREWKADTARQQYAEAMARVQTRLPVVVMDAENKHTHSRYAKLETVQKAIKETYLTEGFTVTFSEDGAPVNDVIHVVGVVRHVGGHTELFHRYAPADTVGPEGKANKTKVQGSQSTVSYIGRRLLCEIFGVTVVGTDSDGNNGEQRKPITTEQMKEISTLITDSNAKMELCLSFVKCSSLSELDQEDYKKLKSRLVERKENQAKAAAKAAKP